MALAIADYFDTYCPLPFKQNTGASGFHKQLKVLAYTQVRQYVGLAGVVAFAILHGHLSRVVALLFGPIEIRAIGQPCFRARLLDNGVVGVVSAQVFDPNGTAVAMKLVAMRLVVF